jgi:hypothetical protein
MAGFRKIQRFPWLVALATAAVPFFVQQVRGQEESVNSRAWSAPAPTAAPLAAAAQQAQQQSQRQMRAYTDRVNDNAKKNYDLQAEITQHDTQVLEAWEAEELKKHPELREGALGGSAPKPSEGSTLNGVPLKLLLIKPLETAVKARESAAPGGAAPAPTAPAEVPAPEIPVNLNYLGRAALTGNTTRLFGPGNFLPSQIPAPGQQFYGAPARAAVAADGNFVDLSSGGTSGAGTLAGKAVIGANGPGAASAATPTPTAFVQQAYGQFNNWTFGISETAFANISALPETLDVAGPNARVSAYAQGVGSGQARLSYALASTQQQRSGVDWLVSLENPIPEIITSNTGFGPPTGANTATFSRIPDMITAVKYTSGCMQCDCDGTQSFVETWDLQFASIVRDLGYENDTNTVAADMVGWGESLSGSYRFHVNPNTNLRDRICFSITYGEGISHYIVDVSNPTSNFKSVGYDAMLNGASVVPLPLLAWYVDYQHNWGDHLRSNFTYSHVDLSGISPAANPLAYHVGEYLGMNLIYHTTTQLPGSTAKQQFSYGVEYLWGEKQILNGNWGSDQQVMLAVSLSK